MNRLVPLMLILALCAAGPAAVRAAESAGLPTRWRVCVTDLQAPPFLNNQAEHPGTVERMLQDSARQQGLELELLRLPPRRCRLMLDQGQIEAALAGPTPVNLQELQFPLRAGQLDASRSLMQLHLVWLKREDSTLYWDGQALRGLGAGGKVPVIGVRAGVRITAEPLLGLGLRVEDSAHSMAQLLAKLRAGRVDLAVVAAPELNLSPDAQSLHGLAVLSKPLLQMDIYLVQRKDAGAERAALMERWWAAIAQLREAEAHRTTP
ncbi:type 2 periplasmic-binding domain-containing protein [Kinneretia aquatilis]|uniref:hypothetical protein n=1 Tax=Kinneretia aquatilis TaxID=2070761 RepID=UPI001495376E|nr:hypothetical protein [Paucibacter aquatile]WIV98268.1 hypothetical protein K9V56_001800 [Paucibacter aquatile]